MSALPRGAPGSANPAPAARRRWIALGALLAAASLSACGGHPDRQAELGSAAEAIAGGYADSADTNVVAVVDGVDGWLCSGSLLAPNVVLTARHCVAPIINGVGPTGGAIDCSLTGFGADNPPTSFGVTLAANANSGPFHAVLEVDVAPNPSDLACGADQAILFLSDPVTTAEAVPLVPRVDSPVAPADVYNAVGYGGIDDQGDGAGDRRRRDMLQVSCLGTACTGGPQVRATEWMGKEGTCHGDSGGPALDPQGRVVGVDNRGAAGCTSPVYGSVYAHADWIKSETLKGATLGGYAAPAWATGYPTDPAYSWPVGQSCAKDADCPSGHCLDDGTARYCTRLCEASAPCPKGSTCDSKGLCEESHPPPMKTTPPPMTTAAPAATAPAPAKSGCAIEPACDPTKPIPWATGAALAAFALLRRRRG